VENVSLKKGTKKKWWKEWEPLSGRNSYLAGYYNLDDGRWTMDDGRWTMVDGRWMFDFEKA
jgi:hypothetical protein